MSYNCASTSERPTLPPIHSLDLPLLSRKPHTLHNDHNERQSCPPLEIPRYPRARQCSTSSSNTSVSRSPSPCLSSTSSSHLPPSIPPIKHGKFTLVPCDLASANAVVLIPPPNTPFIPTPGHPSPSQAKRGQALLLVGSALQHFRHPERPLAKGARMQPYRMVPGSASSRRSSVASTMSTS
ncbi:hypothetical protein BDQ12DRAFT_738181 [Crucibulum laeve]|uniref:Uncharacterized protein n=1 Tax=Crucibulum laeve TaxID=68775 RepID=A0A5C3LMN0_9AGAR|nr:hypothetical protein BDQ12DRAFT_738181 [Crucibulum laeve]